MQHILSRKYIPLYILSSLILLFIFLYSTQTYRFLPSSFIVRLEQDATSSGGSRHTSALLFFVRDKLYQGKVTHTYSREAITTTTCIYNKKKRDWVNIDTSPCTISFIVPPVTKAEFKSLIEKHTIKQDRGNCKRYDICFTIIDR